MRMADAAHVDLGSFYARRPGLGRIYRLAGYGACIGVLWWAHQPDRIAALLVVLLIAWLMAWKREVGALFRAPLVAAIAMCAVLLTCAKLDMPLQFRSRPIQLQFHGPPPADLPPELR